MVRQLGRVVEIDWDSDGIDECDDDRDERMRGDTRYIDPSPVVCFCGVCEGKLIKSGNNATTFEMKANGSVTQDKIVEGDRRDDGRIVMGIDD